MGNCIGCGMFSESHDSLIQNKDIYCLNCKTFIKKKHYKKHSKKCLRNSLKTPTIYDIDKLDKYMHSEVAAIIVEPIQGEGGDKHFEAQIFHELRALADTYSSMLIFDEVQTGLGATGKMWAYEHFGVVPDMMCFGKKTQVCGFCATDRIDEVKENVFSTSGRINSTWGGNIVDMVRFQYIADAIQKYDLVSNAAQVGGHFMNALSRID